MRDGDGVSIPEDNPLTLRMGASGVCSSLQGSCAGSEHPSGLLLLIERSNAMPMRRCAACSRLFKPWPQITNQQYCSEPDCQRERRRRKQQARRKGNPALRDSDAQYLRDWLVKNPNYWKQYRAGHPDYVERNRNGQQRRNQERVAKDTLMASNDLPVGRYQLIPIDCGTVANEDAWIVEITILSGPPGFLGGNCKVKP